MSDFFGYALVFFMILLVRYFAIAGMFYLFYLKSRNELSTKKILSSRAPKKKQVRQEIYWSIISSSIFALFGAVTYLLWQHQLLLLYFDPSQYGYWYLPFSLIVVLIIHETYYYWMHRFIHIPKVFRIVHKVHHNSISTTPWTAFSFHPWESVLEALIIPAILIIIPINIYVFVFYLTFMTLSSVINHMDIEMYPASFRKSNFGKLWIDATHHHFHHKEFNTNFGLYFTFWDKLMGTESKKMEF